MRTCFCRDGRSHHELRFNVHPTMIIIILTQLIFNTWHTVQESIGVGGDGGWGGEIIPPDPALLPCWENNHAFWTYEIVKLIPVGMQGLHKQGVLLILGGVMRKVEMFESCFRWEYPRNLGNAVQ